MQRSCVRAHRLEEPRVRLGDYAFKKLFCLRLSILYAAQEWALVRASV
jgi:hypothetical protein